MCPYLIFFKILKSFPVKALVCLTAQSTALGAEMFTLVNSYRIPHKSDRQTRATMRWLHCENSVYSTHLAECVNTGTQPFWNFKSGHATAELALRAGLYLAMSNLTFTSSAWMRLGRESGNWGPMTAAQMAMFEPTAARGAGFLVAHTVSNSQKGHIWAVPTAVVKENAGLSSIWLASLGGDPSLVTSPGLGRRDFRFHISAAEKGPQVGT